MAPFWRDKNPMIDEMGLRLTLLQKIDVHRALLWKVGIVGGLLALSVVVSLVTTLKDPLYGIVMAALPFAVVFFLILEKRLFIAPLLILFAAGYIPFSLPTGTGSRLVISLVFSIAFVAIWLLRMLVVDKHVTFVRTPANLPVIGFSIATAVSLVWSIIFRDPLVSIWASFIFVQLSSALIMIISPLLMLLCANLLVEEKHLKWMVWLMISIGVVGIIDKVLPWSLPVNTGGLTSMWVVVLAVSLALFNERLSRLQRIALGGLAALWVYWSFIRNISWIAGWLPAFVAAGVAVFFRSKKLLAVCIVVMALYVVLDFSIFQSWFGEESVVSGSTRYDAWLVNWQITKDHLLFGTGPAGYAAYYMTFNPTEGMATHSNYIDVIAETGIVGTLFYLGIFVVLCWRGVVVYLRVKGRRDFIEALSVAALGGTAGCIVIMGFGDWLLPFAYTQTIAGFSYTVYSWLFMGLILVLDLLTGKENHLHSEGAG